MEINETYKQYIYERYYDLKKSKKIEFDNYDLSKIFEYYSCIKLSEEYNKPFYEYNDIDPSYKEDNNMSKNDTGIDCCDMINTIVQCKLRKDSLTLKECSTFLCSQNVFDEKIGKAVIKWDNLIITRNKCCDLSDNLLSRRKLFIDKTYDRKELLDYCEKLYSNPPKYKKTVENFKLRDYQLECIDLIKNNKNIVINLPTGCGKNSVIIYSMEENKKYLILVPRIILMDQLKEEWKKDIYLIGDGNSKFNKHKNICICVFNSISMIDKYCNTFDKIYIDEAHHIKKPDIYRDDDEYSDTQENEDNEDDIDDNEYSDDDNDDNDDNDDYDDYDSDNSDCEKSDNEDELHDIKNYTHIIKSLTKYSNNVYLSATIDKIEGFEYYAKDIREMIDKGYLCDYTINVPIFSDKADDKDVCKYIIENYRNVIVYCNSQKEGKKINKIFNKIQKKSSKYVDCKTGKKDREHILKKFKKGKISVLVNVRILCEGFDANIVKGVVFLHIPSNKTTLIQIIGRALRLHNDKKISNIILPYSTEDDEKSICKFMNILASNDSRIRKSYEKKKTGGYIDLKNVIDDNCDDEELRNNVELKYTKIYSSMSVSKNGIDEWMKKLEEVKNYIDTHGKRPVKCHKDENIKKLGIFISQNKQSFKKNICIMKNKEARENWVKFIDKYKEHYMENSELWFKYYNKMIEFINENKSRPSINKKNDIGCKLQKWIVTQNKNFKQLKFSMSNKIIYDTWNKFLSNDNYKNLFLSKKQIWIETFEKILNYIKKNKKISASKKDWIGHNKQNYKNKKKAMRDTEIYNIWTNILKDTEYCRFFMTYDDIWMLNYNQTTDFIKNNKKLPTQKTNKYLAGWISFTMGKYNKNKITNIFFVKQWK